MGNNIAILILAHHKQEQLTILVNHLQPDFDVYVQIDKKSSINVGLLPEHKNVFYYKDVEVFWGDFSLVENMRFVLEKAFKKKKYTHYLFISGDDFPIKSNEEINTFFIKNKDRNYMYVNPLPIATWGFNNGFDRLDRYWYMTIKSRNVVKIVNRLLLGIQRLLFIKVKRFPLDYYAGSGWLNLNNDAVAEIFDFLEKNPEFMEKLRFSRATDEIWIQSIIMNSRLKDTVIHNDLRYIDWETGPQYPKVLGPEDELKMRNSKALFARKFDYNKNKGFILDFLSKLV